VAPVFVRNFPEVQSAVRMTDADKVVGYKDKLFLEKRFMYADSSFFDIFSMPLLTGDAHTALTITLATVSIQAVKTAMLNPVKNLRTE
jgi:putative ABC transport system permease protein